MKNIKRIKERKNEVATKGKGNLVREKSTIGPEEFEEQRSMNVRMKPQPFNHQIKRKISRTR